MGLRGGNGIPIGFLGGKTDLVFEVLAGGNLLDYMGEGLYGLIMGFLGLRGGATFFWGGFITFFGGGVYIFS